MSRQFSLDQLLFRLGGFYIAVVIAVAQLLAFPGAILGAISIQLNADFTQEQLQTTAWATLFFILLGNLILIGIAWWMTPIARKRLGEWTKGALQTDPKEEKLAWKQITAFTWRYGLIALVVAYAVDILPASIYYYAAGVTNSDQFIYSLLGGMASVIAVVILAVLMIDRLLLPARLALIPKEFNTQLTGRAGALLLSKFQVINLGLIGIAILLIGPIGYHQTVRVLYTEIGSQQVFNDLQFQSIIVSLFALAYGFSLSYLLTRSISDPIRELITAFQKVEEGDLSQRAPLVATDELGEVTVHFNRMVARLEELQGTLEQQVEERTRQLKAANEVGQVASSILNPDELMSRIVNLITSQFGYYYAAVYLVTPDEKYAELSEATGEAGRVLKQNQHRLELNSRGAIATSIREKTACMAQIATEETYRAANLLLPYTRSEVALPLIIRDRVLGALNVQSTKEADFGPQVVETLQSMAGQVAIALDNARLFQQAQQSIKEMKAIQQQYLADAWTSISTSKEELEYVVGDEIDAHGTPIQIPLTLREQALGQITLEGRNQWTADERNLVEAVATQAAIALENARLVSESRQVASRERMLAEITNKIWSSATIDAVLQTTVRELGRRLNATQASIELGLEDQA